MADPKIVSEFRARSLSNNLSLSNTTPRKEEEIFDTETKSEIVIKTDRINDRVIINNITEAIETKALNDDVETVVIVRAEKKSGVEETKNEKNIKIEDEIQVTKDEALEIVEIKQVTELNENSSKSRIVSNDDTPSVAPEGIITPGHSDTQEDMPSFIEWSQKQLEEDEKKKSKFIINLYSQVFNFRRLTRRKKKNCYFLTTVLNNNIFLFIQL